MLGDRTESHHYGCRDASTENATNCIIVFPKHWYEQIKLQYFICHANQAGEYTHKLLMVNEAKHQLVKKNSTSIGRCHPWKYLTYFVTNNSLPYYSWQDVSFQSMGPIVWSKGQVLQRSWIQMYSFNSIYMLDTRSVWHIITFLSAIDIV
jgi:hypothetical protein